MEMRSLKNNGLSSDRTVRSKSLFTPSKNDPNLPNENFSTRSRARKVGRFLLKKMQNERQIGEIILYRSYSFWLHEHLAHHIAGNSNIMTSTATNSALLQGSSYLRIAREYRPHLEAN